MEKKTVTIGGDFHFKRDVVTSVIDAWDAGRIERCQSPDVKHVIEVLEHLRLLHDLGPPGWLDMLFTEYLPMLIRHKHREHTESQALNALAEMGMGAEAEEVLKASRAPNQKGLVEALVNMAAFKTGGNENKAVEIVAHFLKRDPDSVKRTLKRTRSRKK